MKLKTEAAVLCEVKKPLEIMELEIPVLKPGQVLLDMSYSGVCHSQINEARGKKGHDAYLPHCLGHEGSGIVKAVGEGVKKVRPGDPVVATWIKGSGADVPSTVYKSASGLVNSGAISTFMQQTVTCENRLVKIPENMPLAEAALLGCAIPTGAGIVIKSTNLKPGNSIAIYGVGGIGSSSVLAANVMNANLIIAIDVHENKLVQALKLGATHVVNATKQDPLEAVMEITNGKGVDYSIESAGKPQTMESAFLSVREKGGLCILAGNLPYGEKISIDPMELIKGRRIKGTWGGETDPDQDIPTYVDLYFKGKLPLGTLITDQYQLSDINNALDDLENGKIGRAMIDLTS